MEENSISTKLDALESLLQSWQTVAIGYSGGVDSTFLAAVCARALPEGTVLMRLDTPFAGTPERAPVAHAASAGHEENGARAFGLPLVTIPMDPFAHDDIVGNDENRCYYCKRAGFTALVHEAQERGIAVVADGSNADDADDYRPGMRALKELGVRSPLMETGWHKDEERELLRSWGVPIWNMPAGACLATRIPCGEPLTPQKLQVVRACEDYLHELGFQQVRARLMGGSVQVEAAPDDLQRLAGCEREATDMATAVAAAAEATLPATVRAELERRAGCAVEPFARPYGKGNMNGR